MQTDSKPSPHKPKNYTDVFEKKNTFVAKEAFYINEFLMDFGEVENVIVQSH